MDLFSKLKTLPILPLYSSGKGRFVVDDNIGISLLTALAYKHFDEHFLLITSNLYKAQKIYNQLVCFLSKDDILLFPGDELVRAESISQSKEMVSHRLYVLDELLKGRGKIVIANVSSASRFLPDPILFSDYSIHLKVGEHYSLEEIKKRLVLSGYLHVKKVDQSLEFASRGDIIDIFSVNMDNPIRIEFFDDEIESIRYFDIATQTSINKVNEITILPASDFLLSEEEILKAGDILFSRLEKDKEILGQNKFEKLRGILEEDYAKIMEHDTSTRLYKYYSLLSKHHYSLFDYTRNLKKVFVDIDAINESKRLLLEESWSYLQELFEDGSVISSLEMYQDLSTLISLNPKDNVITSSFIEHGNDVIFDTKNIPFLSSKDSDTLNIIQSYLADNYHINICLNRKEQLNTLIETFEQLKIPYQMGEPFSILDKGKINLSLYDLPQGFIIKEEEFVLLTAQELFNEKVRYHRFDNRFKEGTILKSFEDLNPGDYVVHEYQGIGQFLALQSIETDGRLQDYIKLAYSGGEILYVPVTQFQLVRKYSAKEGVRPKLTRLHTSDWERTKKKIKEKVNDLANRLLDLYIQRSKIKGYAFPKDDEFQKMFEDSFEYELTHDQKTAIDEIKADMEKDTPMDRLLCGDVGFGKTEVAFEAAFKAINSGKQVAILCPTTLLARQHYELALQRFSKFEIKIAVFSRLVPLKKQNEYIKEIQEGKIHLVIGTHRLLSKDITFNDLGLLIVDEEQRFGVEQKERLKELKANVDVLTLSATPIPRTLQMSLVGVRALSKIDTAPKDRMPIQTYVTPYNEGVVKELIEREIARDGQVFYLHNDISTLYIIANRIAKLVPDVSIGVAHGQMSRNEIEDVMINFYNQQIKVLICTSIIENGIDVPNANMIIVDDSERYGLSQLYQIKGRVGRGNRIAYAYLMYPEHKVLTEKTQKRLKALQDFTELGSGYRIAQRDLMIRGAGDILGAEQAGFIDSIGLDMYIKLLNETIKEKMGEKKEEDVLPNNFLSIEGYIPDSFASDSEKIEIYQEISSAVSFETLSRIKYRARDMFGRLPEEVEMLFTKRSIDLLTLEAQVDSLVEKKNTVEIHLGGPYLKIKGIGNILFETLIPYLTLIKMSYKNNSFKIELNKTKTWVDDLQNILKSLNSIITHNQVQEIS